MGIPKTEELQLKNKIKQPPVLFSKTQALINEIRAILGAQLVTYWNNSRGSVCHNDALVLYEILEKLGKQEKVYLFIKSSGGNGQAALRLVNLLRQYCSSLVALVPLECASAATMIALGADEIVMGPMAYLTAIDSSLTHDLSPIDRDNDRVAVSLDELTRVIRLWRNEQAPPHRTLTKLSTTIFTPWSSARWTGLSHCRSCCASRFFRTISETKPVQRPLLQP